VRVRDQSRFSRPARDGDPRAIYVLYNPEESLLIDYRRAKVQEKIRRAAAAAGRPVGCGAV